MKAATRTDRIIVHIAEAIGVTTVVVATYITAKELPGLWRYARMMRLSKRGDGAAPAVLSLADGPQYAQAPRRAGQIDHHGGRERRTG